MVNKICSVPIMLDRNNLDSKNDCFKIFSACFNSGIFVGRNTAFVEDCLRIDSSSPVRVSNETSNSLSNSNAFPSLSLITASNKCSGATNSFFKRTASSLLIRIKSFTLGENLASILHCYKCKYNFNLHPKFKLLRIETRIITIKLQLPFYSHAWVEIVSKFLNNRVIYAGRFVKFVVLTKFIIIGLEDYGRR